DPASGIIFGDLLQSEMYANRLDEAKALADAAKAQNLDSPFVRTVLYQLAFLRNDQPGMEASVSWAMSKPGVEDTLLFFQAATSGFFGQLKKSREFSDRAVDSARRVGEFETAADYEGEAALREALYGNCAEAQRRVTSALSHSKGQASQAVAALALAL